MTKILCFGNPEIQEDKLALELADSLAVNGFEFIKCVTPDVLLGYESDEVIIMDVVKGMNKVQLIENIDLLRDYRRMSMHDFDLGFFLKLIKEAGQIDKIKIIGVPMGYSINKAAEEVQKLLEKL